MSDSLYFYHGDKVELFNPDSLSFTEHATLATPIPATPTQKVTAILLSEYKMATGPIPDDIDG